MNLRQLEVFHAIMLTGSVTAAAHMLHVSQPAISAVLRHTEQQLKFKLFARVGGKLLPTPEALTLLPDVKEIFGRVDTLGRMIDGMRSGACGGVVVATSPTLVNAFLPRAVAQFRALRPGVTVAIRSLPTPLAVERVARREVEMGLIYGPVDDQSVDVEVIVNSEIACAMQSCHPLASKPFVEAPDLNGEPVISLGAATRLGLAIEEHCQAVGIPPPKVDIEASSSLTACMMVREGAGLALVDRSVELSHVFHDLTFKPFRPHISVPICLIYPRDRPKSRASVQLAEEIRRVVSSDDNM